MTVTSQVREVVELEKWTNFKYIIVSSAIRKLPIDLKNNIGTTLLQHDCAMYQNQPVYMV